MSTTPVPSSTSTSPVARPIACSDAEWDTRVQLAAIYRLMQHHGWSFGLATHISARVPGEVDTMLLNPYGLMFDEIKASNLVKVRFDGTKLDGSPYRVNPAGLVLHRSVYQARPDLVAAIHSHSETGIAISMLECGLLTTTQTAVRFHERIAYLDFDGAVDNLDHDEQVGEALGPHMALILRNHGLVTVGRTLGESFVVMVYLEQSIGAQLKAQSTGTPLKPPPKHVLDTAAAMRDKRNEQNNENNWQAWLRLADRVSPGFRE